MNRPLLLFVALTPLLFGCNGAKSDLAASSAEPPVLSGPASYEKNCQGCHGAKGDGVKDRGPSLRKVGGGMADEAIHQLVRNGRNRMPGFKQMSEAELTALIAYTKGL